MATFDGANQRLFADGVEIASAPEEGTVRGSAGTYGYIGGGSSDGRDSSFDGMIDELSVWSRALSEEEVSGLYNQGTGRVVLPDEADVVGPLSHGRLPSGRARHLRRWARWHRLR